MPRPQHKVAHPACPHASWAACDAAQKVQWGQCKAVVGDKEPVPCTRWAVSENGWCWQHYASEIEREKRREREASRQLQLTERIDAFLLKVAEDPSYSWMPPLPQTGGRVIPSVMLEGGEVRVQLHRATVPPLVRNKPYRLTEADLADLG